jgi:hypothetical protein
MKKAILFLNYTRDDQDVVKLIYKRLQDEGYNPWMDQSTSCLAKIGNEASAVPSIKLISF